MNINQIRKEIEQIRQHLCADDASCTCQYVETSDGEPVSDEAQAIITANERCWQREDVPHIGYTKIIVSPCASYEPELAA